MAYKEKVYGMVAGRAGLSGSQAKAAVDAVLDILKTKVPQGVATGIDQVMASTNGTARWEFSAPGAQGDLVDLSKVVTKAKAAVTEPAPEAKEPATFGHRVTSEQPVAFVPRLVALQVMPEPTKKGLVQRVKEYWTK